MVAPPAPPDGRHDPNRNPNSDPDQERQGRKLDHSREDRKHIVENGLSRDDGCAEVGAIGLRSLGCFQAADGRVPAAVARAIAPIRRPTDQSD